MRRRRKPTLEERLKDQYDSGRASGFNAGVDYQQQQSQAKNIELRERHMKLVEQTTRSLGQAMDAMAHALQFITKEGVF